jgi:regulatory protein
VDGERFALLDASVAAQHGVFEGAVLSGQELHGARLAGERPLAMEKALNLLSYRARSSGELQTRLSGAGFASETVGGVLERLGELGYLDDAEFARNLAEGRARRGYGPRKAYADLRHGGVGEEVARAAVDEAFSGTGEAEGASLSEGGESPELLAARVAASRRYNPETGSDAVARRVYGFLSRRGFTAGVCAEVAREFRRG